MAKLHEITMLVKELQDSDSAGDDYQKRALLSRVLRLVVEGEDCSVLISSVVKLMAHRDLCVKKMAGEVLMHQSENSAPMVLLAINSLLQDAKESNPLFRGLAVKTLASLQEESVIEHLERIVSITLSDKNAYVRRAAVFACVQLHQMSPSSVKETTLIDTLYGMIRDSDPIVVANCLSALEEILAEEGGVVVNKAIAHYLLGRLSAFPTWSLIQVLSILKKYSPADDDEVFDIMNITDRCLENNSSTVVLMCIDLFLHLLQSLPHLQSEVFRRSQATLVGHLASDNVEVSNSIIDTISKSPQHALPHFYQRFQSFFCRNRDPLYLKLKKISLLPQLMTKENGGAILEELGLYCISNSEEVCTHAMQAVKSVLQQKPYLSDTCVRIFTKLMNSSSQSVFSSLVQVLQNVEISDQDFWNELVAPIVEHFHSITDSEVKTAILCLIGQHLRNSAEALSIIEDCAESFEDLGGGRMKEEVLNCCTKLFLEHPAELQGLLGGLLEAGVNDEDLEVSSRAEFLYRLLESGLDTAKFVLLGEPEERGEN